MGESVRNIQQYKVKKRSSSCCVCLSISKDHYMLFKRRTNMNTYLFVFILYSTYLCSLTLIKGLSVLLHCLLIFLFLNLHQINIAKRQNKKKMFKRISVKLLIDPNPIVNVKKCMINIKYISIIFVNII
jgi:hypothetical protein